MEAGIPMNQMQHSLLSYDFNGPVNDKNSWYSPDRNNFAPRVAVAYTPDGGFLSLLTGKGGVIRAGGGLVYDRFGSDLVTKFDSTASFGLSDIVRSSSVNFTTGQRYSGALPDISAAPGTSSVHAAGVNFIGGNTWASTPRCTRRGRGMPMSPSRASCAADWRRKSATSAGGAATC
jgi:hypothetical protein